MTEREKALQVRFYEWTTLATHADMLLIKLKHEIPMTREQLKVIKVWQDKFDALFEKDEV